MQDKTQIQITQIVVSAGRTFNHPYEQYSNFRHDVHLTAVPPDDADVEKCVKDLQAQAEKLAEDHKQNLLHSLEEMREMGELNREVQGLEKSLKERLDQLRKDRPAAFQQLAIE